MEEELEGSGFDRRVFASKKRKEAKSKWKKLKDKLDWDDKWSIKSLWTVKQHRRSPLLLSLLER